jgi:hypothetical protein
LVLVAPKLKHSQLGAGCFRNGLRFHADPPFFSARETCTATALREYAKQIAFTGMTLKKTRLKRWPNEYRSMRCSASLSIVISPLPLLYAARPEFHSSSPRRAHRTQITLSRLSANVRTMVEEATVASLRREDDQGEISRHRGSTAGSSCASPIPPIHHCTHAANSSATPRAVRATVSLSVRADQVLRKPQVFLI